GCGRRFFFEQPQAATIARLCDHFRRRLRAAQDRLEDAGGKVERPTESLHVMQRVRDYREGMDRFALRISGGTPQGLTDVMRGPAATFAAAAEAYSDDLTEQRKPATRNC